MLETVKTVVYAVLIALVVRTVAYEPFNIPSGSMVPTLLVGDYLFVSKFSYGYSRYSLPFGLPLFSGRIFCRSRSRERGDVAVFKLPTDNSTDYIKRIVGLPGDQIQVRHGDLYINDQLVPRRADRRLHLPGRRRGRDAAPIHRDAAARAGRARRSSTGSSRSATTGRSTTRRSTRCRRGIISRWATIATTRRTAACCRRSAISRPKTSSGSAEFIFFSTDGSAHWWEVWKWPFAIRYSRLFHAAH